MREIPGEQREEGEALLQRRDLAPCQRERLEVVKALSLGQDEATIVRWSGRRPRTVRRWRACFAAGGATALVPRSAAVETPPPTLGLPVDGWTSPRVSADAGGRPKHTLRHLQDPAASGAAQAVGKK